MVITVPAYFSDRQKESTKLAGELAGLKVMKIITEPVAVALAFAHTRALVQPCTEEENILVYNLGE